MGDISPHFSASEFKCPCCGIYIHNNEFMRLVEALEDLRELAGNQPIHINSGYRCRKHNEDVGGSERSQHMQGRAADIRIDGVEPIDLAVLAEHVRAFEMGGIGLYSEFVHVDVRHGIARWTG